MEGIVVGRAHAPTSVVTLWRGKADVLAGANGKRQVASGRYGEIER